MNVAVIIPFHGTMFSQEEIYALENNVNMLKRHNLYAVIPNSLNIENVKYQFAQIRRKRFPDRYFRSVRSYNRLLMTASFYESFIEYDYILICQPDVLILEDKLLYWCGLGYDYIGPPFFTDFSQGAEDTFLGVGNGGFSLRGTKKFIEVLKSSETWIDTKKISETSMIWGTKNLLLLSLSLKLKNVTDPRAFFLMFYKRMRDNAEDMFWSTFAKMFVKEFNKPSVEVALDFGIESQPRRCLEKNNGRFPFGFHALKKNDPELYAEVVKLLDEKR